MELKKANSYPLSVNPIVLYDYQPREPEIMPGASFKGFKGYLQTDAYDGYDKLLKEKAGAAIEVTIVACFAHSRKRP